MILAPRNTNANTNANIPPTSSNGGPNASEGVGVVNQGIATSPSSGEDDDDDDDDDDDMMHALTTLPHRQNDGGGQRGLQEDCNRLRMLKGKGLDRCRMVWTWRMFWGWVRGWNWESRVMESRHLGLDICGLANFIVSNVSLHFFRGWDVRLIMYFYFFYGLCYIPDVWRP
ncbi:hypothetical protein BC829DRAFT_87371 [Chytridium lagenaria]|nr:hypothetical protein BC829DRAFT_87371 [Chytridium lagenaria]